MPADKKYRPSLTADQITHIMRLAKANANLDSINLIKTLAPFEAKIANNAINPAYKTIGKESLYDALGGESSDNLTTAISKPEYQRKCYHMYIEDPGCLNVDELNAAKEYMYVNDLMTTEQEAQWEAENGRV